MNKYREMIKCGVLNKLAYPASLAGTAVAVFVYMYVFFELWSYTFKTSPGAGAGGMGLNSMIWYLLATEIMILSQINVAAAISASIRDGSIAIIIGKPVNLGLYNFFMSFGESIPLLLVNAAVGGLVTFLLVGALGGNFPANIILFAILGFLGLILNFLISYLIGLLAIVLEDTSSVEWIYSKLLLVIGGALIPLDYFPVKIKALLDYLPFSAIIYKPAMVFVGKSTESFSHVLLLQGFWIAVAAAAGGLLYRRLITRITINGG